MKVLVYILLNVNADGTFDDESDIQLMAVQTM